MLPQSQIANIVTVTSFSLRIDPNETDEIRQRGFRLVQGRFLSQDWNTTVHLLSFEINTHFVHNRHDLRPPRPGEPIGNKIVCVAFDGYDCPVPIMATYADVFDHVISRFFDNRDNHTQS